MDEYQHSLFFEARDLTEREEQKIRRHFQKKRDSGGGDCGTIEKAGGNTYKISFKEKEESGYAVLVGKNEAVKERIAILEKSLPTRKEVPVVEKQLKLVEEEFSREMLESCPGVKIHRDNTRIILEGPDKEVQSGAAKLDELIKKVKEKRVKFCTALLTFMKSSGAISKYQARFQQSLRNPVLLEVGSDLLLSSLSFEALNEVEGILNRDLSLANVQLQGAAAVPPDLDTVKTIMIKAKNEANSQELKVDVSFIPEPGGAVTKVRLVGYSEHVNKLKEVLHDFQMNQVETQEMLNLPHPGLVDCFNEVLNMIGMKQTKVTFKTSHSPYPCVLVSGPRCLVQEAQANLNATLGGLTADSLILDGPGAQRYFQAEGKLSKELIERSFQVLIKEQQSVYSTTNSLSTSNPSTSSATPRPSNTIHHSISGSNAANKTSLEIKLGSLEDEQVDVLVVPLLNRNLNSTKIAQCLLSKAGNAIKFKFCLMAANCTLAPGDVLQVDAPPTLGCSKVFFIECLPWDGVRGQGAQALSNGLKKCLDLCVQQHLCSVAFPIIGPGVVFKFPREEAIQVLTGNIRQFGLSASSGSLTTIHIVIEPDYPDSEKCYHDVYRHLSLNMNQEGQAIFRSLSTDLDDITMTVRGGVKLQLVFGDITNETTDAVVNTTDFKNFQIDGVCKDILTVAGPEVETELKAAQVNRGDVFVTQPGSFPCEAILHLCGERDASLVEQLVCKIIEHCETFGFKSVAIPAICAGNGGLDPGVVAGAILRGIEAATSSTPLYSLTDIHLVLIRIKVFLAFKEEAMQMFSTAVKKRAPAPQLPLVQKQQQSPSSVSADLSILRTTSTSQRSVFLFLGLSRKEVDDAMTKLKDLYQAQCATQTFKKEEMAGLTVADTEDLKQLVETHGLYMQRDQAGQGSLTVSGLKDGVNQVMQIFNASRYDNLKRAVRVREEEDLYARVAWCIMGHNGNWERLPKTANHNLETNDTAGGIVDTLGIRWSVELQRLEATRPINGQTAKLKRLVNLSDFTLPLYWDNMADGENFKMFELQPSSAEYRTVKEAFKRTAPKTIMKIERLQNVHLRRAYEVQKKHISEKNIQEGGAVEKLLYHGTTQENCDSIMKTGFNRRFAGQNATSYGHGTYFAVNASYSAHPTYSKPAADGSQLMFVVRVLTGIYTLGQSNMRIPPPRSSLQPHDRCDSVVDRMDNPNMYVVFHDNQAYPDYLITFR
ncbi:protein mono-ADP-ribosyltransferase PARP14-like [Chaetodon trifascialis]|uniref:protein mono-ADP-ribosyltransferase PARP14-like n=1 Tax=Chaetodon trifascialis TaxID=109706 RepID=UPI003993B10A